MLLSNPGISQSSTELIGALGLIQRVGNFHTVQPNISDPTGLWLFSVKSTQLYTIRVAGKNLCTTLLIWYERINCKKKNNVYKNISVFLFTIQVKARLISCLTL